MQVGGANLDVIRQVLEELEAAGVQHHISQVATRPRLLPNARQSLTCKGSKNTPSATACVIVSRHSVCSPASTRCDRSIQLLSFQNGTEPTSSVCWPAVPVREQGALESTIAPALQS